MGPGTLAMVIGFGVLSLLCLVAIVESRRTRRIVELAFDPERMVLAASSPTSAAPGSSGSPSVARAAVAPAASDSPPFKPPALGPSPNYAAQARRPAPDAEDADSEPELPSRAPETSCKPGAAPSSRKRPAVTSESEIDRVALARALDDADQAQADQAPATAPPTTRPTSSAARISAAPPASGPIASLDPSVVAAGLGERPSDGRQVRSEPPPPRPSLLGALKAAPLERPRSDPKRVAAEHAARSRKALAGGPAGDEKPVPAALLSAVFAGFGTDDEATVPRALPVATVTDQEWAWDSDEEATRVAPRPSPEALGLPPDAAGKPRVRAAYHTQPSMTAVVPASTRPPPSVDVVERTPPPKR